MQRVAGIPRTLPPTPGPAGKRNLVAQSRGSSLLALTFLGALPLPIPRGRMPEGEFCGYRVRVPWAATRVPLAPSAPTHRPPWTPAPHIQAWLQATFHRNKSGLPHSLWGPQIRAEGSGYFPDPASQARMRISQAGWGSASGGTVTPGAVSALTGIWAPSGSFNSY